MARGDPRPRPRAGLAWFRRLMPHGWIILDKPVGLGSTQAVAAVNALLASPAGRRDWPLRFYSRELLFSTAARLAFVPPDLAPLPCPC